ncbi:PREDICTED: S-phase kinase-associated protein 1-like [Amphimedon queenslandica]|uniref:SKP1 component dimerisation domain-containing protein n=1 Tax=Amphimedon queenslandica TaxID=400682 RepID=A0AAN0JD64_AMPQE|nr:PREDICTED: S-phase kinase-associated protein 1-like [Amphimedon queenslandica]|eukprot:XP_019854682.1 PREDICTED: S-phase kinase-associated protein 1-like [Amphimedon queenslandica]
MDILTAHFIMKGLGDKEELVEPIPLPNVSGSVLGRMIAWSEHHVTTCSFSAEAPPSSPINSEVPVQPVVRPKVPKRRQPQFPPPDVVPTAWEKDFLERNREDLYDLLLAANYLDVKRLMDLLCARVADLIKGKDPAKIRKTFHVPEPS